MSDIIAWAIVLMVGTWFIQDAIASVLYYLKTENWHYNHALRLARLGAGIALIVIALIKLMEL